jgi:AraC-like DNA-binding protein
MNTSEYVIRIRMTRARRLLEEGHLSISEVAIRCGFTDQSYFTRMFKKTYNLTPTQVKKTIV